MVAGRVSNSENEDWLNKKQKLRPQSSWNMIL